MIKKAYLKQIDKFNYEKILLVSLNIIILYLIIIVKRHY